VGACAIEEHVAEHRSAWKGEGGVGQPAKMATFVERETGVVADRSAVAHEHQIAMDGDRNGYRSAR
jgi:hypothetical protein